MKVIISGDVIPAPDAVGIPGVLRMETTHAWARISMDRHLWVIQTGRRGEPGTHVTRIPAHPEDNHRVCNHTVRKPARGIRAGIGSRPVWSPLQACRGCRVRLSHHRCVSGHWANIEAHARLLLGTYGSC